MIPILIEVDVLITGAAAAVVDAALSLKNRGMSVMVASDMSYLGQDTAGMLACAPINPAQAKRELEQRALQAGIGLLYLVRPVSLQRDHEGRIAGVVLAARTSLFAVKTGAVLDMTQHGLVYRIAGALPKPGIAPQAVKWNVVAKSPIAGARQLAQSFGEYHVYETIPLVGSDPLTQTHEARASLLDPSILAVADILDVGPKAQFDPLPDIFRDPAHVKKRTPGPVVPVHDEYHFAPGFLRNDKGQLHSGIGPVPTIGSFDVVVAGAGTAGAPAGISAARQGAKTLVLDIQRGMGGVGTLGLISSYWHGNKVGFTDEVNQRLIAIDELSRSSKGSRWNPELKTGMYHHLLQEASGTAWMGSFAFGVKMQANRVTGVLVSTPMGPGLVQARCVVDATGNADIAAAAGARCRVIGAQHVAVQGTGLSPRATPATRGQNSDHTFVDECDPVGVTHAFVNARAKFKDAFDNTPIVNSRERRQIHGDMEISPLDILAQRTFPDTVFTAISNFDTHGFIVHPVFMVATPDKLPLHAHVPFRCMLPQGIEGVLVTGLGMSAHRDALPVIRMQADVQNQGFAAGMAAAMTGSGNLRDLPIRTLQQKLVEHGVLAPEVATHQDSFPVSNDAVQNAARNLADPMNVALVFANPDISLPALSANPSLEAQLILGLMRKPEAGPALATALEAMPWDQGWNFTGMGQFGASMSPMDVLIISLARSGYPQAARIIAQKIDTLRDDPEFSHCRAVAVACVYLPLLAPNLAKLLSRAGMTGYAQVDSWKEAQQAIPEINETRARTVSLRELYLVRGLFQAGDVDGLGQRVLQVYAQDLRGPYARHAAAVLSGQAAQEAF
jgi:hypothetical protein